MSFTPPKKEKLSGIFAVIMYLAAGLLLLFRPDIMNELTRWAVTAVLVYYAVRRAIAYFKTPAAEAAKGYGLTAAMMALTAALFTFITSDWMTYRLWGLLILFGGYMKFQTAWDFFRLGHRRWWWIMIGTAVSLLLGILIATGVIPANVTVWFGVALLIEAVLDIAVQVIVSNSEKLNAEPKKPEQKTPDAQPETPDPAPQEPTPAPEDKPADKSDETA